MAEPRGFQFGSPAHEADTALTGMWLFLASEMLFFGGLVYVWAVLRIRHGDGVMLGTAHTNLALGTVNTALLLTSSLVLTIGVVRSRHGRGRAAAWACIAAAALGTAFLAVKGIEWASDLREGLFPGPGFIPQGEGRDGARLFFSLYFVATGLHGLHMLIGLGLLGWTARSLWPGPVDRRHRTQMEVTGLYWSFVDTVWIVLYPLLYLVARP